SLQIHFRARKWNLPRLPATAGFHQGKPGSGYRARYPGMANSPGWGRGTLSAIFARENESGRPLPARAPNLRENPEAGYRSRSSRATACTGIPSLTAEPVAGCEQIRVGVATFRAAGAILASPRTAGSLRIR